MILVATIPDNGETLYRVYASHDDSLRAFCLATPDYAGRRVYRSDVDAEVGAPIPAGATWLNPPRTLKGYAKELRDAREWAGAVLVDGSAFPLDERTQTVITKASGFAARNAAYVIPKWRLPDNTYRSLDAPTILLVGDTMGAYVGSLFVANSAADAAIDAGTVTTEAQVLASFNSALAAALAAAKVTLA